MKLIIIIIFSSMVFSSDKYKEPEYKLLDKSNNIEIREYSSYVVARTSLSIQQKEDNNMFRTLASYIFGGNENNESIPMTAPVTTYGDDKDYHMIFYMLDADSPTDLPNPNGQEIKFEDFTLGKCAVVSFSWFTSNNRVKHYTDLLKDYIAENNLIIKSPYMVNRYDPPWRLPFLRRNEILVKIN